MSKVIASLEKVLLPFAVKIGKQPHVNAIKNGFIKLMPLTLAGAMFVLINNVFLSFGEGSFFYSLGIRLDASTIETLNGFKAIGGNVYNGTLGIMSLMAPFFIGMALAEERKVDPLAAGLLSVAAFMTVTPYSVGEAYAVGANWLGGANIISGIVIGLVVAEIELGNVDEIFAKPAWLGAEATHAQRYYNLALASHPYAQWRDDERLALDLNEGH